MERPTCKSCPYWRPQGHISRQQADSGLCKRYPVVYVGNPSEYDADNVGGWAHPIEEDNSWCGEHPDFPAYIASLKGQICPTISLK